MGAVEDGLLKSATVRQSNTTETTHDNIAHRTKQSNWNEAGRIKKGVGGVKRSHITLRVSDRNTTNRVEAQWGHMDL